MTDEVSRKKDLALIDLLDRILDKGVVIYGDLTISVADVDLVYLGLKLLLTSIESAERMRQAAADKHYPAEWLAEKA